MEISRGGSDVMNLALKLHTRLLAPRRRFRRKRYGVETKHPERFSGAVRGGGRGRASV